jgi:hypothetical protein
MTLIKACDSSGVLCLSLIGYGCFSPFVVFLEVTFGMKAKITPKESSIRHAPHHGAGLNFGLRMDKNAAGCSFAQSAYISDLVSSD